MLERIRWYLFCRQHGSTPALRRGVYQLYLTHHHSCYQLLSPTGKPPRKYGVTVLSEMGR